MAKSEPRYTPIRPSKVSSCTCVILKKKYLNWPFVIGRVVCKCRMFQKDGIAEWNKG